MRRRIVAWSNRYAAPVVDRVIAEVVRRSVDRAPLHPGSGEGAPAPAQGEVAISGSTLTERGDSVSWTVSLTNTGTTALTGVELSFAVSPGNRLKNRTPAATVNVADVPVGQSVTQVWSGRANKQGSGTVTAEALSGGVSLGTATLQLTVQK